MKNKKNICISWLIILLLSSCTTNQKNSSTSYTSNYNNTESFSSCIIHYDVYEQGAASDEPNEFSTAMNNDPISVKMENDLLTQDILGAREAQAFFDGYVKIWQNELLFSINNLKKYLSDEDITKFDTAQTNWENSLKSNNEFDRSLIENNEIFLGTQYVSSSLIYLINQYRERVFHVKYMTYLAENYVSNTVPNQEQLWNKFA